MFVCCRRQDDSLDDIEQHVNRIGRMGRAIGEELEGQVRTGNNRSIVMNVRGYIEHVCLSFVTLV